MSGGVAKRFPGHSVRRIPFMSRQSLCGLVATLFPLRLVLFVALFAWILQAWVDMRLVFQWRESQFLWNLPFLGRFLARPGAMMEWTDRLLVQSCYWGWPGVIAVAAAAWLLLVATVGFMNAVGRARVGGTWIVPAILLAAICAVPVPSIRGVRSGTGHDCGQWLGQDPGPPSVAAADLVPYVGRRAILRRGPGVLQFCGVLGDLRSAGRKAPAIGGMLPAGGYLHETRLGHCFFPHRPRPVLLRGTARDRI